MAVTAKFIVSRVTDMNWATEVELVPDYAQGRNAQWAAATPAGMIRMTIKNELAAEQFAKGKSFTVTFEAETEERVWDGSYMTYSPEEKAEIDRKNAEHVERNRVK